eukprot:TRINITY_DN60171_c0_g1_i1.p1 TRINITY_DN60171_c0_g1~~TRINITY_DN60171_c0_g1_i1.p1  ORF type:complete len:278 (-),score=38.35 TRINITY_DN60171_c0_g1_i1:53-886(-)
MAKITVVGAGRMGRSIGGQLALNGANVCMYDHSEHGRLRALEILKAELRDQVNDRCLRPEDEAAAMLRVRIGETLADAAMGADLVIEAIFEDLEAKRAIFRELDELSFDVLPEHAILGSNSMNFQIEVLASDLRRRSCGIRFLFPVYFIKEIAVSSEDQETVQLVSEQIRRMGFEPFVEPGTLPGAYRRKITEEEMRHAMTLQGQLVARMPRGQVVGNEDASQEWGDCAVCLTNAACVIMIPCGHACCCNSCADQVLQRRNPCPICREPIEQTRNRV